MRRVLLFVFVVLAFLEVRGQYIPQSGQPFQYAPIYNPAFTGVENFMDIKLGHRYQWGAFKESVPQFSNLAINFRTKQPLDIKTNALRPSRTDYTRDIPTSKLGFHGLGFNVYSEKLGPLKEFGVGLHYAVHFPLSEKLTISGGVGAMYENSRLRGGDEFYWGENVDTNDPVYKILQAGDISQSSVWTRVGVLVYGKNFYVGGTYYPWNTSLGDPELAFDDQFYSGSLQVGYSFPVNDDFDLKPGVLALWQIDNTFVIDYQAKVYLQDKAWFGLTYRDIQAGVVSGGFNFGSTLSASYSYEFALGKLRTFSGSTHELVLSARLRNYKQLNQRTW